MTRSGMLLNKILGQYFIIIPNIHVIQLIKGDLKTLNVKRDLD